MLNMALVYYLLRPTRDVIFRAWWKTARYGLLLMFMATASSVISLISVATYLFFWFTVRTDSYCLVDYSVSNEIAFGITLLIVLFLFSMFVML